MSDLLSDGGLNMKELSLYILDITMNSVKAGAKNISISLGEYDGIFSFSVEDDGCGMTKEQLERLSDPFFTTRTTRKVGLGVPFLRMLAEQTGGYVEIKSRSEKEYADHGTELTAVFREDSIDFIPLGDIVSTVVTLIQGSPEVNFLFTHNAPGVNVRLDTSEIREVLGEDVPLSVPEVLAWIRESLEEQYGQK